MDDSLQLTAGRQPSAVVQSLRQLILQGTNFKGGGIEVGQLRNSYLEWVEVVERVLRNYFDSPWVWDRLHSARWAEIINLKAETPRPYPLINGEAEAQTQHLIAIVGRLEALYVPFELPSGCVAVVPDTNVFLHYRFFNEIDWPHLAEAEEVRLVVPLLVIGELDKQKVANRVKSRRRRAGKVLSVMRELRKNLPPQSPAQVRRGVGLQVLMEPVRHVRHPNDDEEILDRTSDLASLVEGRLLIATGDHSMELRAVHRGLKFLTLPDELLLSDSDDEAEAWSAQSTPETS